MNIVFNIAFASPTTQHLACGACVPFVGVCGGFAVRGFAGVTKRTGFLVTLSLVCNIGLCAIKATAAASSGSLAVCCCARAASPPQAAAR